MRPIRILLPVALVSLLGARAARAEEADSAPAAATTGVHVALGVNSPLSWSNSASLGASLYAGFGEHHAIRANLARYDYRSGFLGEVAALIADSDGDEGSYGGRITDVGIGWVYYPRRPWSGWMFELGVLRRARDHRLEDEFRTPEVVATRTTTYAGRALVGWSWLMYDHVFLAVAVGLSLGHESGTETTQRYVDGMAVRTHVSRSDVGGEGLLRLGVAFDL